MIKALIFTILAALGTKAIASGCDSNFFQNGEVVSQVIVHDFGQTDPVTTKYLINMMTRAHKNALHYWSEPPALNASSSIKIVTTKYSGLDTDCGWSKYGSNLSITHLEIKSDKKTILYPDIYANIYPEYSGVDELIELNAFDLL